MSNPRSRLHGTRAKKRKQTIADRVSTLRTGLGTEMARKTPIDNHGYKDGDEINAGM